jgi:L-threonylcarbamoyladenylate synthase
MARRHTRLLPPDEAGIQSAAEILRSGGLVAFPTETVYGLGASALDAAAARGVFEAKGRPADDPLIVHLADFSQLALVACDPPPLATILAEHFWPGPLTLVLRKQPIVPAVITAGLETVAVRLPAHPVARALLEAVNIPLAAPSANLFGRPSPTQARHVLADLDGRIDAIVEGGPTLVGVESTIVDLVSTPPQLLRPGGLAAEEIEAILGLQLELPTREQGPQPAPGLLPVHYAPRTPLILITGLPSVAQRRLIHEIEATHASGGRVGVIALEEDVPHLPRGVSVEVVGTWSNPAETAKRLFDAIRALDSADLDVMLVRELASPAGLGRALADRLRRASRRIIDAEP